jgi:hypothetical protein
MQGWYWYTVGFQPDWQSEMPFAGVPGPMRNNESATLLGADGR